MDAVKLFLVKNGIVFRSMMNGMPEKQCWSYTPGVESFSGGTPRKSVKFDA
jgi:hypothetical protein